MKTSRRLRGRRVRALCSFRRSFLWSRCSSSWTRPGPCCSGRPGSARTAARSSSTSSAPCATAATQPVHREHVTKLIQGELGEDDRGPDGSFKLEDDSRITKVGRVIRRTSIDELPQLLNVLKGEMSLIGPRPPLPYEAELYTPRDMRRLEVLPGMTGLWQVSGRARLTYEESVDLDIAYVDRWSLAMDARILLKTFSAVVGADGAG